MCQGCDETLISYGGGRFVACTGCPKGQGGYVDQERWGGNHVRLKNAELIQWFCPMQYCHREDYHLDNQKILTHRDARVILSKLDTPIKIKQNDVIRIQRECGIVLTSTLPNWDNSEE